MFEDVKERIIEREKLLFLILSFVPVLVIFLNSNTLKSSLVGIPAFLIYLLTNGEIVGRAFFEEEKPFFRLASGLLTFIVLVALTGILSVLIFQIEEWYLLGMIFAAIASSVLNQVLVKYDRPERKSPKVKRSFLKRLYPEGIYILYIVSFALCFFLLLNERSGWVDARPSIWAVIPPAFLSLYLVSTVILMVIVFLPGKTASKLLLIVLHSTFSLLFVPIMVFPGLISKESWYDFGRSKVLLDFVASRIATWSLGLLEFVRAMNSLLKGLSTQVLIATFAGALNVDAYWSDVLLVPVLWGVFIPLTSYKLTEMIGGGTRASMFAALLTIANFHFLAWGKLTMSDSVGFIFFVLFIYLLFQYLSSSKTRILIPIFMTLVVVTATHFLPTVMSIALLVLTFALKKHGHFQFKRLSPASFFLLLSFVFSVFLLPMSVILRGIVLPMLGESAFSIEKLLKFSIWAIVFGVTDETPVRQALSNEIIFPVLGLIGSIYVLRKKDKFNKTLCLLLFLAFGLSIIDHRILSTLIVGGLFGAGRLNFFRDVAALPFVAVVIESVAKSLSGTAVKVRSFFQWKKIAAGALLCISLSSWVTLMVYDNYAYYASGFMGTSFEVDAIKFIDENTDSRYVVFAPMRTTLIARGFLGYPFPPEKQYVDATKVPSVAEMYGQMEGVDADIGYFLVPSFAFANFDEMIDTASRIFGLFQVLPNDIGEIYIFNYKIPPLPKSPDVMAFYWSTPPTYYVQTDLMRVIINPATKSLAVQDFWGDLYESIELNEATVGGNSLGNLTSVEYLNVTENEWLEWTAQVRIAASGKFQFKLCFENESLVGLVEREKQYVQLEWESGQTSTLNLQVGDLKRLYIPGLIGGPDSYDVNSRKYGFLYTTSLSKDVVLYPAYGSDINGSSLTYGQIVRYCGFNSSEGYMWYDLYVHNTADMGQWSYIEVYLPDHVYLGTYPPLYFSVDDGKTWSNALYNVETQSRMPITTIGGTEVNWIFTVAKSGRETPSEWRSYMWAHGGSPMLPGTFTDSGGAQNRIIFGFYLPAKDKALVRVGASIYYFRPLKVSYVFRDSDNPSYGLRNMEEGLIKYYNLGPSEYVGGLMFTGNTTSLVITQDEAGNVKSILIKLLSKTTFSLLAAKGVDTEVDENDDGIPDLI